MSLPANWNEVKRDWERRVEDVLVEMMDQKTGENIAFCVNITNIVNSFNKAIKDMEYIMERNDHFIRLYMAGNEK